MIDGTQARQAYEGLEGTIDAVALSGDERVLINLQSASVRGLTLSRQAQAPAVRARFEALPEQLFDPRHLSQLEPVSLAAAHVHAALRDARSVLQTQGGARLDAELVNGASTLRERMLTVGFFVLGDDPICLARLKDIRAGAGYEDLALDLARLATLYEDQAEALAPVGLRYDPEDATRARDLNARILRSLDQDSRDEIDLWTRRQLQTWTLLRRHYEEVQQTARWLMRDNPDVDERFPSLFAGRGGRSRAPLRADAAEGAAPPAPEPPGDDAG